MRTECWWRGAEHGEPNEALSAFRPAFHRRSEHRGGCGRVPLRPTRERPESSGVRGGSRRISGIEPSRASHDLGDCRARDGARGRRRRGGRRGDRSGDEFCGERECGGAGGRQAGIRRYRTAFPQHQCGSHRVRDHGQNPRHHAGALLRTARGDGCAHTTSPTKQACGWWKTPPTPSARAIEAG